MEALRILKDEQLPENAAAMGDYFRTGLAALEIPGLSGLRGKGLMSAVDVEPGAFGMTAREWCEKLLLAGLLVKQTHEFTVRMSPPLMIREEQVREALGCILKSLI
jgi:ornithine--oxo-acid transaminase